MRPTAIQVSVKIGSLAALTDNASSRPGSAMEIRSFEILPVALPWLFGCNLM